MTIDFVCVGEVRPASGGATAAADAGERRLGCDRERLAAGEGERLRIAVHAHAGGAARAETHEQSSVLRAEGSTAA